jgi:hypothetical protein
MSPIDYSIDVQTPFQATLQGYQAGAAIRDDQFKQQQQDAALAQQQQQQKVIQALIANPNPTGRDYANAALAVPGMLEPLKQAWGALSQDQQQNALKEYGQVHAAVTSGQTKAAIDLLNNKADALENSGAPQSAIQERRDMAKWIESHPTSAQAMTGMTLATILGPEKFTTAFPAIGKEQREAAEAPAKLRTANAKAATDEADATLKSLGIIGQTLGALQGKDVKPEQVATAFKSLAAKGVIGKDELPDYLAGIPQDAKALDSYLGTYKMAGMKPEEQMKYTTPTADAKLSSDTQITTTGMNNRTQLAVQDRIGARQDAKGDAEPTLDGDTLTTMAQQYLAGDKSVMQNLGRGAQGAANIVALRKEITVQAKAQGMTGPQIAAAMADYVGMTAGMRTSGTISARIENAAAEAAQLAPLAIDAGRQVSRSGFLPFGKAQVMFDTQSNDPALNRFRHRERRLGHRLRQRDGARRQGHCVR